LREIESEVVKRKYLNNLDVHSTRVWYVVHTCTLVIHRYCTTLCGYTRTHTLPVPHVYDSTHKYIKYKILIGVKID